MKNKLYLQLIDERMECRIVFDKQKTGKTNTLKQLESEAPYLPSAAQLKIKMERFLLFLLK